MVAPRPRRLSRKSERGATVLVVVLATTLIAAIGVLAVRNAAQVDLAVGYSRQAAQTMSVAELGTTVALAQVAAQGAPHYIAKMQGSLICASNPPASAGITDAVFTCYPLGQSELEMATADKLFQAPATATGETGSFGPFAEVQGNVSVELTAMAPTNTPVPGARQGDGSYLDVTMTSIGNIRPIGSTSAFADECEGDGSANIPRATVKKMMRAHAVVGPIDSPSQ